MNSEAAVVTQFNPRGRLTPVDWEQAGLDTLGELGVSAVAVEPLARRLGVTKGSFYWHFPSREALLKIILERWELQDEEEFALVEAITDPKERMRSLFRRTGETAMKSHAIYASLLRSPEHPIVQPVLTRVTNRRLAFLTDAYRQAGYEADSAFRARLAYAAYAGFLQLSWQVGQQLENAEFDAYTEHTIQALIPD
ncbi:TetR/AcrR family transcriptional regulator [Tahibacter soli]|uniref:TetR/AcrR family transcriptional regulator n=1 Tax=Tahibacter soli TaxID=2983605 RepID=A0A9X3YHP6_9GAMM|nr:TetR/AcrR family transcriptional regulator [Tahibacter soli]MDC8011300.1 TetR/AcrR family transcriptional regulator [Tahibacter soli]